MLMNNCGEHIHRHVIDNGLLPILVKIVKKKVCPYLIVNYHLFNWKLFPIKFHFRHAWNFQKECFTLLQTDLPVRERIFLLLDAMQTALGGASGKFPQYYAAYYDLVVGSDIRLHKLRSTFYPCDMCLLRWFILDLHFHMTIFCWIVLSNENFFVKLNCTCKMF